MKPNRTRGVITVVASLLLIIAATWIFFNRQYVQDWMSVRAFNPSSGVAAIADRTQLTSNGKFIFYATHPTIEGQDGFNKACPRQETGSPILGCYTTEDRIYVYNLTNQQLDGMEEVTAVHEMLHAVWARTNESDRQRLATQLKEAYDRVNDPELKTRMDYYLRTEPGEFTNELHSILGTEFASLGEPLESYYGRFFNRGTVLSLHQQYKAVYSTLYTRADSLYSSMQTLSGTIQSRSKAYDAVTAQFNSDVNSFNTRARSNGFTSQAQFANERASLVQRSRELESDRQALNGDIATYNGYYDEYQKIAKQIDGLNNSVDSFKQIEQAPSL